MHLICRIIDIDYTKSLYELVCAVGVLETMYARNYFDLVKTDLNMEFKLDQSVSVRQAVNEISIGGGQGMVKCNCTAACMTSRCGCKKLNLLCNSRCHGSNSQCKNK